MRVEDADQLYVAGHDEHPVNPLQAINFAPEPIYEPGEPQERLFVSMMLELVGALSPWNNKGWRACGRALWRGRQHRFCRERGKRVYVPTGSQHGWAGRLGCSVRYLDQLLRIARAAGFVDVWQMPKKQAKSGQAGRKWGYAVFSYLQELPEQVTRRLRRRRREDASPARAETAPSRLRAAAAPAPERGAQAGQYDGQAAQILAALRSPSRAPP
ncbi:MAG TPA: hypothetical protein VJN18_11265 [Polyangiaceae bacterium]|nr:hypothetical protein [Polyangiaceae bacterium]